MGSPRAARALRVGGIDYLNAQPLLHGLSAAEDPPLEVRYYSPRELAARLLSGELEVALIPVVAYPEGVEYRVVPGIGVSSYGAVRSIRLYHRRPLAGAATAALDACSRTSALLARLLFREVWGGSPRFLELPPAAIRAGLAASPPATAPFDAALLIGDAALGAGGFRGWEEADLGTEWTRWTGLPFVYAFWACRLPEACEGLGAFLVERLTRARDEGVARIDEIVERAVLPPGLQAGDLRRYLSQVIQYDLGADKLLALQSFFSRLRAAGLVERDPLPLRFLPAPRGTASGRPGEAQALASSR
jgi:chorismate dehydratase